MGKRIDLVGKKFGRWTVLKLDRSENKKLYWLCKCDCGTRKSIAGLTLRYGSSTSCGCYKSERTSKRFRKDLIGQIFGYWLVLKFDHIDKHNKAVWKCQCKCGNLRFIETGSLVSGNSSNCGCIRSANIIKKCRKDLTNKRFGKLVALKYKYTIKRYKSYWECKCDCGNLIDIRSESLLSGKTKSCGCLQKEVVSNRSRKNLLGHTSGLLTVIDFYGINKHQHTEWKCKCQCGRYVIKNSSEFSNQNRILTCGNCKLYRNGVRISVQQVKLQNLLYEATQKNGILNFKCKNKSIDIAVVINSCKIAIEYYSWFYHGFKQNEDKIREQFLLKRGWKLLIIKSGYKLPSVERLESALLKLTTTPIKQITLYLSDWKKGLTLKDTI